MKKTTKPSTLSQILKLINIARLYIRYQIKKYIFLNNYGGNKQSIELFDLQKNKGGLHLTLIEKIENAMIFHGHSKYKVNEKNFGEIERLCQKNNPGTSVTMSMENDDPHLFKIVLWNETPA